MYNVGAIFWMNLIGLLNATNQMSLRFQWILTSGLTPMSFGQVVSDMGEVAVEVANMIKPLQSEDWSWTIYSVGTLDDTVVSGQLALPGGAIQGEIDDSDLLPPQTTLQVSFATGRSRHILRKAVMATTEGQTGPFGNYSSATVSAANAALAPLLLPVEATNGAWNYCFSKPGSPGIYPLLPQSVKTNPVPCVQRRRRT